MLKGEYLQQLLKTLYEKDQLNPYDYAAEGFTLQSDEFKNTKSWAGQLVKDKLAAYMDPEHTRLHLTNFGKYWVIKGGYESFLKEGHRIKDHPKESENQREQIL